jgi:hypothetical protein
VLCFRVLVSEGSWVGLSCVLWGFGLGFFVFVSFGSRGLVLVGFFLSFFGLFFYFKLCVLSCILPVYQGAPDAFNKVSLLLIKKNASIFYVNQTRK